MSNLRIHSKKCFYVFKKQAPAWFKEDPAARKITDKNLNENPARAKEASRIIKKETKKRIDISTEESEVLQKLC